jgi:hypothetical protein
MNIIEGEWDPYNFIMIVITIIFSLASLFFLAPFFVECLIRINDWWINYYWIPCLLCGVS